MTMKEKFTFNPETYNTSFTELCERFPERTFIQENNNLVSVVLIAEWQFESIASIFSTLGDIKKQPLAETNKQTIKTRKLNKRQKFHYRIIKPTIAIVVIITLLALFAYTLSLL